MLNSKILISVIIPMYNAEKFIEKTILSIINQTLKEIEIIVVDDASTDQSYNIVKNLSNIYPKIILIKLNENYGSPSYPRNVGVEHSNGKYITFVDADDTIENVMYDKMYKKAIKDHSDIVICGYKEVDENGDILNKKEFDDNFLNFSDILEMNINPATWNKIYKKELFTKYNVKFQHKIFCEDLGNTHELFYYSKKNSLVNEPLYNYLVALQGASQQKINKKYIDDIFKALETNKLFLIQNNIFKKYLVHFFRRYVKQLLTIDRKLTECKNDNLKLYFKNLLNTEKFFIPTDLEYLLNSDKLYFSKYFSILKINHINYKQKFITKEILNFLGNIESLSFINLQMALFEIYLKKEKELFIYGYGAPFKVIEQLVNKLNFKILGVIETENKNRTINYPYGNLKKFISKINNKSILIISETFYDEILHQIIEFKKEHSFNLNIINEK
ncbi:glycosyltransferase family 2 protein [Arcobacter sp.]|uniref:glycosyltransferase family 2 protein n=1 Tax=Arcobacter sp. TaxID=1872629 RepID=UPI003D10AD51